MMTTKSFLVVAFAAMHVTVEGSAFLKATTKHEAERVSEGDVQTTLLTEIEASLGTGIGSKRISDIQDTLQPMFLALPKNQYGNLEPVTVRYALHRVFAQRHGWSIKGLSPGDSVNSSSPTGILADQVPAYIQNLFEERLDGRGLGLFELATFAATIEHLVHNEAIGRLGAALKTYDMLPTALVTAKEADMVLDTYMMAYILGEHLGNLKLKTVKKLIQQMPEIFLAWPETQSFVRQVRQNLTSHLPESGARQIDFATMVKVAEIVGEQFGKFQDVECKGMKDVLTKIEDRGSGRVRLADFYKPAAANENGSWQFQESMGYLRELGTLDESNPADTRVMISNYLISQTNCIASSDYYSVCCMNECEGLFAKLEKDIAAPEATPARILELISNLPSSSVVAPRQLSDTLRTRLESIATEHGGLVQLHSRLFSQWMHHAYPRECPFPHLAGTTSQVGAEEWEKGGGDGTSTATQEELLQFTSNSTADVLEEVEDLHDLMMWTKEEELLVVRQPVTPTSNSASASFMVAVKNVLLFSVVMSVVYGLARSTKLAREDSEMPQKFMV